MITKFFNGLYLTPSFTLSSEPVFIEDEKIIKIGEDLSFKFDKEIDLDGNLLMPGFINCHTHSAMTIFRSYADDLSLHDWLFNKIFPLEANLQKEDIYNGTKLAILEYLQSGITTVCDMYFHVDETMRACKDAGFKVLSILGGDSNESLERVDSLFENYNKDNYCFYQLGFHADYTCPEENLDKLAEYSKKYNSPVYTHCSETEFEHNNRKKISGKTPLQYLVDKGIFDNGGTIFHGVYLDDDDLKLCVEKNISVVTNPCSNIKLASGIADTFKMKNMGINVAIGTDGAASNNALDFFREIYLASTLQKIKHKDAACVDAIEVLKEATVNGAKALHLKNIGEIKIGNFADLIILDLNAPNMQPKNDILKNIVYAGNKINVKMTMVNGKILYQNGKFYIDEDQNIIYERANQSIKRLKESTNVK